MQFIKLLFRAKVNPNLADKNGNTAFHLHVHTVSMLKEFRLAGADFLLKNDQGQLAHHLATSRNQSRLVSYILSFQSDQKAVINFVDSAGNSALFYAVKLFVDSLQGDTNQGKVSAELQKKRDRDLKSKTLKKPTWSNWPI